MKHLAVVTVVGLAAAIFQGGAYSQDAKGGEALAKQSGCLNCHAIDTKKVGPSFKEVAAKNKGVAADKIVANMKTKPVHQAPLKSAKEDDLKAIAAWLKTL